jgi:threonine aldolase
MLPLEEIEKGIRGEDVHYPDTSLICLENAHGSGVVLPLDYMEEVYMLAKRNDLNVHLDGARLFNAATFLGVEAREITKYVDSVTFCLSKGLAAPIGSILCGSKEFIRKARRGRKMLGGGMRQVGVLGAPGIIALEEMSKRLHIDHENAQYLASLLEKIEGFKVDIDHLEINMVFVKADIDFEELAIFLKEKGILIGGYKGDSIRLACHNDITKKEIDLLVKLVKEFKHE